MGATLHSKNNLRRRRCFNPRARDGRDYNFLYAMRAENSFNPRARDGRDIPIYRDIINDILVSIHAPVMGATNKRVDDKKGGTCFNPRARDGRDKIKKRTDILRLGFNPRARDGRDDTGCSLR